VGQNKSNSQWDWFLLLLAGFVVLRGCVVDGRESPQATYNRSLYPQPYNYLDSPTYIGTNPYVAENGSYRGQISRYRGRPKTVYVRGYYRRGGTYVRSHYRSPPR